MDVSIAESEDETISEPDESPVKKKKPAPSRAKASSAGRTRNLNATIADMSIFAADDDEDAEGMAKVIQLFQFNFCQLCFLWCSVSSSV